MKITFLVAGKTEEPYIKQGIDKYLNRLKHYIPFRLVELPEIKDTKSMTEDRQKMAEAELILKNITPTDYLVLLDETGKELSSVDFAALFEKKQMANIRHLVFLVGGPYGFDERLYKRASEKLSLSKMTFSHQMVRLFFVEQVYRAFTILKGEPYHHQ